jgi:hypothetical protein
MITTQKTLDALKTIGLIIDWKMKTYRDGDLKWKSPVIISDNISISNETYGKESFLYFSTKTAELAKEIAKVLSTIGGKPDFGWCSDNPSRFALQVSHFNGFHWWE